ncbi:MAG: hypothetical protein ACRDYB_06735 [Acidimicrobiales bacterium]
MADGAATRHHWKGLATLAVALWLVGAVAVVFFHGLGSATRSGSAEAKAAQYQRYLGPGWFPLEVDQLAPATATTPETFIGLNYSSGRASTIRPDPSWRVLRLRLAPIPCPGGGAQSIVVRQGADRLARLTPPVAWATYSVSLTSPGRPVTLTYGCVTAQQAPGRGLQTARHLAVLLAGVSGLG